jgi:hypothetical protein
MCTLAEASDIKSGNIVKDEVQTKENNQDSTSDYMLSLSEASINGVDEEITIADLQDKMSRKRLAEVEINDLQQGTSTKVDEEAISLTTSEINPWEEFISVAKRKGKKISFYTEIEIYGTRTRAFVDCGATRTFVGKKGIELLRSLDVEPIKTANTKIIVANSNLETVKEKSIIPIKIRSKIIEQEILWMPSLS